MNKEIISKYREDNITFLADLVPSKWKRVGFEFEPREYELESKAVVEVEGNVKYEYISSDNFVDDDRLGLDNYIKTLGKLYYNGGYSIEVEGKGNRAKFVYTEDNKDIIDYNFINVAEGAQVDLVFDYKTTEGLRSLRNSTFVIKIGERADVNIIFVQRTALDTDSFSSIVIDAERDAHIKEYFVELGGKIASSSNRVYLGENTISETYSIYLADRDRKVDLEYSAFHKGRRSESIIEGRGIVKDKAKKVFRGNLKFERGSAKSKGREEEFALLLDKGVKADSIPTLLCDEDDVIGEHAASAGSVNQNKLFYLTSRGLSPKEAEKLVILSSFKPILEKIGDKSLEEAVVEEIERRV